MSHPLYLPRTKPEKSTYFFREIIEEFGSSPQARKAQQRISQLINKQ